MCHMLWPTRFSPLIGGVSTQKQSVSKLNVLYVYNEKTSLMTYAEKLYHK